MYTVCTQIFKLDEIYILGQAEHFLGQHRAKLLFCMYCLHLNWVLSRKTLTGTALSHHNIFCSWPWPWHILCFFTFSLQYIIYICDQRIFHCPLFLFPLFRKEKVKFPTFLLYFCSVFLFPIFIQHLKILNLIILENYQFSNKKRFVGKSTIFWSM